MPHPEAVGLGYKQAVDNLATFEELWKVFVIKVYHPELFLPVTAVKTRDDGRGFVYREMTLDGGKVLVENIYLDEKKGEIRFVVLDARGGESGVEHVNVIHRGPPLEVEYYQRAVGGERVHWEVPREMVAKAIRRQIDMAIEDR